MLIREIGPDRWELVDGEDTLGEFDTYDLAVSFLGDLLAYIVLTAAAGDESSTLLPESWMSDQGICFSEATTDGRDFSQCQWSWRDPNMSLLPLMLQTETEIGHFGAELAGFMQELHMVGTTPQASGRFYATDTGRTARDLLADGRRFGVSVDATNADVEWTCIEEDEDGYCLDGVATFNAYEVGGLCYSDDTEILTEERGWQRFSDLLPGERVATRNQKSAEFEWQTPTHYTNDAWDQPMIRFFNKSMDLLVTPNHRMLVQDAWSGKEMFLRADELAQARPNKYKIPATSIWHDDDVETFWIDGSPAVAEGTCACGCGEPTVTRRSGSPECSIDGCMRVSAGRGWCNPHYQRWYRFGDPLAGRAVQPRPSAAQSPQVTLPGHGHGRETSDLAIDGDHFAAFLGAWLAEGCLNKNEIMICQMPASRGFESYQALLAEMAPMAWHDGRKFRFKNVRLAAYLRQFGHAPDKFIPQELKNFSRRQLRLFWDAYVLGDGSADGRRIYTTSKRMAGDLQEIAQKIGLWANVTDDSDRRDKYRTFIGDREILPENKHDCYLVNYRPQTKSIWLWHTEEVPYSGMVRCVTVPNETLYVRRNGKVLWCGNTMTPFPAFANASIIQAPRTVMASADPDAATPYLLASAPGVSVMSAGPSRDFFEMEEPALGQPFALGSLGDEWLIDQGAGNLAMPLHIDPDGSRVVAGHLAYWSQCFAGETEFLTYEGVRSLKETVGTTQTVLVSKGGLASAPRAAREFGGEWVDATIESFGVQPLMKVTLGRFGQTKEVYATPKHRWLVTPTGKEGYRHSPREIVLTADLVPDARLSPLFPKVKVTKGKGIRPSQFGVAHGFTFGDGTRHRDGCRVDLLGEKDEALLPYFAMSTHWATTPTANGVSRTRVSNLPAFFKDLPSRAESLSYLYGWLAGYFAADGTVSSHGTPILFSATRGHLEFVRDLCHRLGVGTTEIKTFTRKGARTYDGLTESVINDRFSELHRITLVASTLTEEFFINEEHRRRFVSRPNKSDGPTAWRVISVEETDRVEEVFCAVVPEWENFTLLDNINVMNCHVGFPGQCITPPESMAAYAHFHVGETLCADGTTIATGSLTASCDHAVRQMRARAAQDHYAHNGIAWANVRVTNGVYGPWVTGALRADVTDDQIAVLRAGALSGDWRRLGGNLELIGALAVTGPGFPIAREALIASGLEIPQAPHVSTYTSGGELQALVASGIVRRCPDCARRSAEAASGRPGRLGTPESLSGAVDGRLARIEATLGMIERRTRPMVDSAAAHLAAQIRDIQG